MRIPEELLSCVTFLCVPGKGGGWRYGGTAYFVTINSQVHDDLAFLYFVTAKHCVEQAGSDLAIRLNSKSGGMGIIAIEHPDWHFSEGATDVAVLPWHFEEDFEYQYVLPECFATPHVIQQKGIGVGDELVITGLFTEHYGEQRNRPIVRMGHIAAMPNERIHTTDGDISAYIAEVRSLGGLSGSPVFVRLGPGRPVGNTALDHAEYFLLGQIRGHWDYPTPQDSKFGTDKYREVNMGMALITPVTDLLSVLYSDELGRKRQEAEQEITNQKSANS